MARIAINFEDSQTTQGDQDGNGYSYGDGYGYSYGDSYGNGYGDGD